MFDHLPSHLDDLPRIRVHETAASSRLSEADFSEDTPYVVRGLVSDWPMVKAGNESSDRLRSYLLDFYNKKPLVASFGAPEIKGLISYADDMSMNTVQRRTDLLDVFKRIAASEADAEQACIYIAAIAQDAYFPGLQAENPIDLGGHKAFGRLWMGTRSCIPAHNDSPANLACVVTGRRRFTLFPPHVFRDLYLGPIDNTPAGRSISMVDTRDPDFAKYPRFREALEEASVAELGPGDAIFIPPLWWHNVEGLNPFNILINYWWRRSPEYLGNPQPALNHALLALRDLPQDQKDYWREVFDYYVFRNDEETVAHIPTGKRGVLDKLTPQTAQNVRNFLMRVFQPRR
ncbi:MAG: cupin-like domain-containing protein [Henriciella sp.]|nr:cupin-like domain-containing protein [Henriciella sp.]